MLYNLKNWRGKKIKVIETAALKWKQLALALNIRHTKVRITERSSMINPEEACSYMLEHWMDSSTREPVNWKTLIEALKEAEFITLAKDVELALVEQ